MAKSNQVLIAELIELIELIELMRWVPSSNQEFAHELIAFYDSKGRLSKKQKDIIERMLSRAKYKREL